MGDQIKIKVGLDGKEAKTGLDELKAQQAAIKKQQADDAAVKKYDAEAANIRKKAAFEQLSASERIVALERERLALVTQIATAQNAADRSKLGSKLAQTETDLATARQAAIKRQQADDAAVKSYDAEATAIRKKAAFEQLSASEKIVALERERLTLVTQIAAAQSAADRSKLGSKLAQTETDLANAKQSRKSSIGNAALGAGALVGTAAVMVGADILQEAGQLADLSTQFNIASDSIQRIGNVAGQSGVELTNVASALNKTAIGQEKARKNSEEHVRALEDLGISVQDYINLSPEEAFYAVADAVSESEDRGKAYSAVVQLMGKSAGELFSTLEMGGAKIRETGEAMGTWSAEVNAKLDDAGDQWAANWNKIKVEVAQLMAWAISAAQTLGVVAAKVWGFLTMNQSLRDAAGEEFDKIWGNGPKEDKKPDGPRRDREAQEEEKKASEKLMQDRAKKQQEVTDLETQLSDVRKKAAFDALKPAEQFNVLLKERAALEASLKQNMESGDFLKGKIQLAELDAEILKRRETADAEAEKKAADLADKKAALAEKEFKASLDGMSAEEKKNALLQKRIELQKQINAETDEGKKVDLQSKMLDLKRDINGIKPEAAAVQKRTLIAGGLTNLGIGYAAALSGPSDPQKEIAKNTKDMKTATDEAKRVLEEIRDKVGPSVWNK